MNKLIENLPSEQKITIKEQIERFKELRNESNKVVIPDDKLVLPKGTLIHGTFFEKSKLKSISHSGIITGQFFGIEEDGETYYCADFHKVPLDQSLEDYNNSFPYNDGRCPFGNLGKNTVAFLIYPDDRLNELIEYDCFDKDSNEGKLTRSFVNEAGLPYDDNTIMSSILFGVPSNFINGIVIGDNVLTKENVDLLTELYPEAFLTRNNGEIVRKQNEDNKITDIRVNSAIKSIKIDKISKENKKLKDEIDRKNDEEKRIWNAISTLPVENIKKIYEELGFQGDLDKYAEKLKSKGRGL